MHHDMIKQGVCLSSNFLLYIRVLVILHCCVHSTNLGYQITKHMNVDYVLILAKSFISQDKDHDDDYVSIFSRFHYETKSAIIQDSQSYRQLFPRVF
jgi:hypothetical protein